tara:strand:+ start:327 stop:539 length:213 start_codon:yes stop_codon:yes gene_type:complete
MKKQPNKWLVFSSLSFQIAIIMFVSVKIGNYLDIKYNLLSNFFSFLLSAFSILAIIWLVYKQSKKFWNKE